MPYLSRLVLNPSCEQAFADLASAYRMHRTVMRAFTAPRDGNRVLYRLDRLPPTGAACLLVQSSQPPDWSFLQRTPGYLATPQEAGMPNPAQTCFVLEVGQGEMLSFRLRANPTFRRGKKRLGYRRRSDQLRWLTRQGAHWGFEPLIVSATQEGTLLTRKPLGAGSQALCFVSVLFTGVLRVVCAERLQAAAERGLGSGKAFGFGLLSLARRT